MNRHTSTSRCCSRGVAALLSCVIVFSCSARADTQINVVGLFRDKAMLVINGGPPRTLADGQTSPEGVKLLSADSTQALLEVEGKRKYVMLGQAGVVAGVPVAATILYANKEGHFFGIGSVNGKPVRFLLDTGATAVAMSSAEARRIGIDYVAGTAGVSTTAGGMVKTWGVTLGSVKLGGITLNQVEGVVIDGDSPPMVLLGMSALNRIDMKRDGITMNLSKKY